MLEETNKKRYILLFILILAVLLFFVFLFFYFNIYILICMVILIIILSVIYLISKPKSVVNEEDYVYYDSENEIEAKIQDVNDDFALENFYRFVKDVLHLVGNSYSKNNINMLTGFVGNDLIKQIKKNMEEYNSSGNTRVIAGINVRDLKLTDFYVSFGYQYIELHGHISKIDCTVQNGVVIEGHKKNGKYQEYKLVFCKKNGDYTPNIIERCPLCGALSTTFSHGKCLKCGNIVINIEGFYLIKMDEV